MKTKWAAMTALTMAALGLGLQSARAGNVAWSVGFSSGGFSAAVSSAPWAPPPVYVAPPVCAPPAPVFVQQAPVVYVRPAPVMVAPPVVVAPLPVYAPCVVHVAPRPFVGPRWGYVAAYPQHYHHARWW